MFKRTAISVITAAAVIIPISACEPVDNEATATNTVQPVAETPAVNVATKSAPETTTVSPKTVDDVFLSVLEEKNIPANEKSISAAKAMCEALDAGNSMENILMIAVGELGENGGYFVGASVAAYCPEYSDEIDRVAGN